MITKTQIEINNTSYELEIYQMDEGIVTGFKFDDRLFLDAEKTKEAIDLFIQMSQSNFFDKQNKKINKANTELEVPATIPIDTSSTIPSNHPENVSSKIGRPSVLTPDVKEEIKQLSDKPRKEIVDTILKKHGKKIHRNKISKFLNEQKPLTRAPDNTALFLNWLSQRKCKQFDIKDFIKENPTITLDSAKNIITHQINKKKLAQVSATTFLFSPPKD
jgi:hypothetical protein